MDERRAPRGEEARRAPRMAILVPARNESHQISACLDALLHATPPSATIIVLDDESSDDTWARLSALRRATDRDLRVVRGRPRPPGWRGKNWACAQLADHASDADILVFVDADTRLVPGAAERLAQEMVDQRWEMASVFPRQEARRLAALLVYLFPWSLVAHAPLFVQRWRRRALPVAVGQVIAFQRSAYASLGGHAGVKGEIAEDLALARKAARRKMAGAVIDGASSASCTMYTSWGQAWRGFQKNWCFTVGHPMISCLVWAWLAYAFGWLPLCGLAEACLGHVNVAALLQWPAVLWIGACAKRHVRMPIWVLFTAPVSAVLGFVLAVDSWIHQVRDTTIWS